MICLFRTPLAMAALLCSGGHAAATLALPVVPVGDPGNTAFFTGVGRVNYAYNIGTYEVTAGQYAAFLNAVARTDTFRLYNSNQARTDYGSGISRSGSSGSYTYGVDPAFVNRPVNYVSFWDACRFANWMQHGQPVGNQGPATTEDGAYTLTAESIEANTVTRNAGWRWALPNSNEWYKAAYYKGNDDAGYWRYPTRSDTAPGRNPNDPLGNNANYLATSPIQSPYWTTAVGEFENSAGPYGTFDQAGNLTEWIDDVFLSMFRRSHGGGAQSQLAELAIDQPQGVTDPNWEDRGLGFRLIQIPAPPALPLIAAGALAFTRRRRAGAE